MRFVAFIGLLICGTLLSCEKWKVSSDIPDIDKILVVNAALSPVDSVLVVYVGRASTNFSAAFLPRELAIGNAEVVIFSDNAQQQLTFAEATSLYEISANSFLIETGKRYRIEVKADGQKLSAECTIPKGINSPTLRIDRKDKFITGTVNWESSEAGQAYRLDANATYINQRGFPQQVFGSWDYDLSNLLKAEMINQRFEQVNTVTTQSVLPDTTRINFEVNITTFDINGTRYLESAKNANDTPQTTPEFFDRFISPSIRFSNVQNGLGIVLGYNKQTLTVELN